MSEMVFDVANVPAFGYGDRFYMVDKLPTSYGNNDVCFKALCPACHGTRKLKVKGLNGKEYECNCPECYTGRSSGYEDRLRLPHWVVLEYTVHEVSFKGPLYKTKYGKVKPQPNVSVKGFCTYGRSSENVVYAYASGKIVDADISAINLDEYSNKCGNFVFSNRKNAEELLELLYDYDRNRLAEFNERFGTEHKYPFGMDK